MPRASWPMDRGALEAQQTALARAADAEPPAWSVPETFRSVASFVAVRGAELFAAAVAYEGADRSDDAVVTGRTDHPYELGLLALREGPILGRAVGAIGDRPDVVLVNATGRDHPRGAGLALHLGAVLDVPTVGVTDRPLVADGPIPAARRGATATLTIDARMVGVRLRTRTGVRPVCVHAAWRTDADTAAEIVRRAGGRMRTPRPLREARRLARVARTQGA